MTKIQIGSTFLLCCMVALSQNNGQTKQNACNRSLTFCWYGPYSDGSDEVEASGDRWTPQDSSEKPIEWPSDVRCVKRYGICIEANSRGGLGKTIATIDIFPVTRWDSQQVNAERDDDPCERNSLILTKQDRSTLLISSPGSRGNSEACGSYLGKPKTVVYKLAQK